MSTVTYTFLTRWGTPGLVGTLAATVKDDDNNILFGPSTSVFTDVGDGDYVIAIPNWDTSWRVAVTIDDGITMTVNTHSLSIDLNPTTGASIVFGINSYSSPADADLYFATKLNGQKWINISSGSQKQLALNDATRLINKFAYYGCKTTHTQKNQWPRSRISCIPCDIIPEDILNAQYEIAYAFLVDKIDTQKELSRINVTSRRFAGVATTYDNKNIPDYLLWGIPSWLAWSLLFPYIDLSKSEDIRLNRVN